MSGTVKTAGAKMSEIALMNREKIYLDSMLDLF